MGKERKPDFFIVGAPKCGTTAMAGYLEQHPDIYMPDAKDSNFFGSDLNFINNVNHPSDLFRVDEKTYMSWFRGVRNEKRVGEASVWYLYSRSAVAEIKRFSPDADIIIMLRNPADMIYSLHSHFLTDLNEDIEDFEEAFKAEEDRVKGVRIPATAYIIDGLFYKEVAKYYRQVKRYFDVFGRDKVHVVIFDDFKKDTEGTYGEILKFLGVKDSFSPDFTVVNPSKKLRSTKLQRFIVNPPGIILPLAKKLSTVSFLRNGVNNVLNALNQVERKIEPMNKTLRDHLNSEFAVDINKLGDLLGRDLNFWMEK